MVCNMKTVERNVLVLAYLGDTIYENYVRRYLVEQRIESVNELQKKAVAYVSAKKQAQFVRTLLEKNFFSEEEIDIIMRARNYKTGSHPKNCSIVDYKYATGLESLIGYLTLEDKHSRIDEIMNVILGGSLC